MLLVLEVHWCFYQRVVAELAAIVDDEEKWSHRPTLLILLSHTKCAIVQHMQQFVVRYPIGI